MTVVIGIVLFILGLIALLTSSVSHDVLAWVCLVSGIILIVLTLAPFGQRYR